MQRLYPGQPVVGVGALIIQCGHILLVRRGKEPAQGLWSLPGGAVELGEALTAAIEREILEECGLKVKAGPVVAVLDSLTRDNEGRIAYHYVLVDFWAEVQGGQLKSNSDAREARWVPLTELYELQLTKGVIPLLKHLGYLTESGTLPPNALPSSVLYWTQESRLSQRKN